MAEGADRDGYARSDRAPFGTALDVLPQWGESWHEVAEGADEDRRHTTTPSAVRHGTRNAPPLGGAATKWLRGRRGGLGANGSSVSLCLETVWPHRSRPSLRPPWRPVASRLVHVGAAVPPTGEHDGNEDRAPLGKCRNTVIRGSRIPEKSGVTQTNAPPSGGSCRRLRLPSTTPTARAHRALVRQPLTPDNSNQLLASIWRASPLQATRSVAPCRASSPTGEDSRGDLITSASPPMGAIGRG